MPEKPFMAVLGFEEKVRDGRTIMVDVRHQHITAMRDYKDFSFEEVRMQYSRYICKKQTGYLLH
jgi:hypothetical protein